MTSDGRTGSFTVARTDVTAVCVNGDVMVSRESFVTWDFSSVAAADRRGRASFPERSPEGEGDDGAGAENADWSCSARTRLVESVICSCLDMLCGIACFVVLPGGFVAGLESVLER